LNQKIFLHYFSSVRLQKHLEKLRTALHVRKNIMEEELSNTDWEWVSPQGGLNLWIKLPKAISVEALLAKSLKQSISFVPGTFCDPSRELQSSIRLSYSFINEVQLREGLRRLVDISHN
jgi:GntR family transcriptional regulator of abcA and norABC